MLPVMYEFYVHRIAQRWRLVLARDAAWPAETRPESWRHTRTRASEDTNPDVRAEVEARGYCLFAIGAEFRALDADVAVGDNDLRAGAAKVADGQVLIMDRLDVGDRHYSISRARVDDLGDIVALLANDPLGATRENTDLSTYALAFHAIEQNGDQLLAVVKAPGGALVGTMQLTVIPCLPRGGATRLQVEGVRIHPDVRGSGLGQAMMQWAHEYGRRRGATISQLTSDLSRPDAHQFYERLGYTASHLGFKRAI